MNHRTPLDLHGPNETLNWTLGAAVRGPLPQKALQGPFKVHIDQLFYIDL